MCRHYYKCRVCLSVTANAERVHEALCGVCEGRLEHMGEVHQEKLFETGFRCPCDDRCTSARGPSCNCRCGGVNHGSNLVVPFIREIGKLPTLTPRGDQFKAKRQAKEFREGIAKLWERANAIRSGNEWIPEKEFREWNALRQAIERAKQSRDHAGRMRTIAKALGTTTTTKPEPVSLFA